MCHLSLINFATRWFIRLICLQVANKLNEMFSWDKNSAFSIWWNIILNESFRHNLVIYNLQPLQYLLVTEKISWAYCSYAICKMASLDFSWRRTLGSETIFGNWKPFKNDEKYFLFHLESFFRSQDFWIFVLTFWSCSKAAWLERSG